MKDKILVSQPYLPDPKVYQKYIDEVFSRNWLTNNGPLNKELTERLKRKTGAKYLLLVANGTIALQIAIQIKQLKNKSVLTTPFTFAATNTALAWEGATIEFCDIDPNSWNMCPNKTEEKLKQGQCDAILPVNLFGMPCDLDAFEFLSKKYNVPLIFDSAHAPFSNYKGTLITEYGDIHCISLHATKLFHTVEGGAITFKHKQDFEIAKKLINFGQDCNGFIEQPGINGKLSEIHAAMGLSLLDELDKMIEERMTLKNNYKKRLANYVELQTCQYEQTSTPIYMPIKLRNQMELTKVTEKLNKENIYPRHYFCPDKLRYINAKGFSHCDDVASRVLCLPLYNNLGDNLNEICDLVIESIQS